MTTPTEEIAEIFNEQTKVIQDMRKWMLKNTGTELGMAMQMPLGVILGAVKIVNYCLHLSTEKKMPIEQAQEYMEHIINVLGPILEKLEEIRKNGKE